MVNAACGCDISRTIRRVAVAKSAVKSEIAHVLVTTNATNIYFFAILIDPI